MFYSFYQLCPTRLFWVGGTLRNMTLTDVSMLIDLFSKYYLNTSPCILLS